jgi:hypothetical protein
VYDQKQLAGEDMSFLELAEETVSQLEGAFALVFKSTHFPQELVVGDRVHSLGRGRVKLVGLATPRNYASANTSSAAK